MLSLSKDITDASIKSIKANAEHHQIDVDDFNITTESEFKSAINKGLKYDYVYIAGHANDKCIGEDKDGLVIHWNEIAEFICSSDCLNENAIIMLYCCRGGLNQVAYQLFATCPKIQFVCGVRQSITNIDLAIGFNVFIYNIEIRKTDPIIAAEKATLATENRFSCFDRLEVESEPMYFYNYCKDCDTTNI